MHEARRKQAGELNSLELADLLCDTFGIRFTHHLGRPLERKAARGDCDGCNLPVADHGMAAVAYKRRVPSGIARARDVAAIGAFIVRWNLRGLGIPEKEIDEAIAIASRVRAEQKKKRGRKSAPRTPTFAAPTNPA